MVGRREKWVKNEARLGGDRKGWKMKWWWEGERNGVAEDEVVAGRREKWVDLFFLFIIFYISITVQIYFG